MKKRSRFTRLFALLLAFTLAIGVFPLTGFAEADPGIPSTDPVVNAPLVDVNDPADPLADGNDPLADGNDPLTGGNAPLADEGRELGITASAELFAVGNWVLVDDASKIIVGRNYLVVDPTQEIALTNKFATIVNPTSDAASIAGMAGTAVTIKGTDSGRYISDGVSPDMIWQFGAGGNTAANQASLGVTRNGGYQLFNAAPGVSAGLNPLRRLGSNNLLAAPINTTDSSPNAGQQSLLVRPVTDGFPEVSLFWFAGLTNGSWNFALKATSDGFAAIGNSNYTSAALLTDYLDTAPLLLFTEEFGDAGTVHSIMATAGANGKIIPSSPTGHIWVEDGSDQTFTIEPDFGYEIDTLTIDGATVTPAVPTYTFENVSDDTHTIHVTFKQDTGASDLNFIVYNDNFASGEFTTAMIIDLGEGKTVNKAALDDRTFTITANNVQASNSAVALTGQRPIRRVYPSSTPVPHGYQGDVTNSPGYDPGDATGRYIIIELAFYTAAGGPITLVGEANSTIQNYSIAVDAAIDLVDGGNTGAVFFKQDTSVGVPGRVQTTGNDLLNQAVNPLIDKFTPYRNGGLSCTQYIHKDDSGNPVGNLPLYIYFHGGGRSGGANDPYSPLRSKNGAIALAQLIHDPVQNATGKYNAHMIVPSAISWPILADVIQGMIDDGLVDKDRIYASGFSAGGQNSQLFVRQMATLSRDNPDMDIMPAAIIPIGMAGGQFNNAEATQFATLGYWAPMNRWDAGGSPNPGGYPGAAIMFGIPGHGIAYHRQTAAAGWAGHLALTHLAPNWNSASRMSNATLTVLNDNRVHVWPYNQWEPSHDFPTHESEAAVHYNSVADMRDKNAWVFGKKEQNWNFPQYEAEAAFVAAYPDSYFDNKAVYDSKFGGYNRSFDWLFDQERVTYTGIATPPEVDEIPYGVERAAAVATPPATGALTLGNYLPEQVEITTTGGPAMANVTWDIASLTNSDYNPNVHTPQTFNVTGTVTLPESLNNDDTISKSVTVSVTVDGGKKANVPFTNTRPTIDEADWSNAVTLEIGDVVRRSAEHPTANYPGSAAGNARPVPTASGEAKLLWDNENLYVRLKVNYTSLNEGDGTGIDVNGVEVFLSENATRGNQLGDNMNLYRLSSKGIFSSKWKTDATDLINSESWRRAFNPPTAQADPAYGDSALVKGYYELFYAIPLLDGEGPAIGKKMVFDIQINDATAAAAKRTAEVSWNDPAWNGSNNSIGWGEITLTGAPLDASDWVQVDPADVQVGKSYVIVSEHGALTNAAATINTPGDLNAAVVGMAAKPVVVADKKITSEVTPDMIWQFGQGGNTAAANGGVGAGAGFRLMNGAPGAGAGMNPLRRESSNNAQHASINTTNGTINANQQSILMHVLDAEEDTVGMYIWGGNNQWNFVLASSKDGFIGKSPAASTTSGAQLLGLMQTVPSLKLYEQYEPGEQHYIMASSGANGSISPSSLTGHVWVGAGEDATFTFTPAFGFEVDKVTVNGAEVAVTGNTYTFENVDTSGSTIHVTFKPASNAADLSFTVYNDIFSAGDFTTAVIIDLGEGKAANLADLSADMFTAAARNTRLNGTDVVFDGTRNITRAYVNTEPAVLGYKTPAPGSGNLVTNTPASGRYIILEFEFWDAQGPVSGAMVSGGLQGTFSTILNYRVNTNRTIKLSDSSEIIPRFTQTAVVNPVLDKFVPDKTNPGGTGSMDILISIDESWKDLGPLPLFIYNHGGNRGGSAGDFFAPVKTANGAAMLSKYQLENPGKYNAHIIATQNYGDNQTNNQALMAYVQKLADEGKVDMNRIYMSGFSMGSQYLVNFYKRYPEFFAAIVPAAGGTMPTQAQIDANPGLLKVAIWAHQHKNDTGAPPGTNLRDYFKTGLGSNGIYKEANLTILETNQAFNFPYYGYDWSPHETEAQLFSNRLGQSNANFRYGASQTEFADKNIFDWMFAQAREPVVLPDKTALDALIAEADKKVESDYTSKSWAVFAQALSEAKDVSGDENATQAEIDAAIEALQAAMDALEDFISVQSVKIDGAAIQQLRIRNTKQFTATVNPTNATDQLVTWESSNEKIFTVEDGLVKGVGTGSAKLIVTCGGKTSFIMVQVTA